jgi:hypothetical protein
MEAAAEAAAAEAAAAEEAVAEAAAAEEAAAEEAAAEEAAAEEAAAEAAAADLRRWQHRLPARGAADAASTGHCMFEQNAQPTHISTCDTGKHDGDPGG